MMYALVVSEHDVISYGIIIPFTLVITGRQNEHDGRVKLGLVCIGHENEERIAPNAPLCDWAAGNAGLECTAV